MWVLGYDGRGCGHHIHTHTHTHKSTPLTQIHAADAHPGAHPLSLRLQVLAQDEYFSVLMTALTTATEDRRCEGIPRG